MKKSLLLLFCIALLSCIKGYSQNTAHDTISINNIAARINSNGNLFWDQNNVSDFRVPKSGSAGTIFNTTLWIAGLDSLDTLHVAAERYDQNGHDFWSGPVSNVYDSAYDANWDKTWKVTKAEIDDFKAHWNQSGYTYPQSITMWPAHGNTALGQGFYLAPFFDFNGDGQYDPYSGDYPLIKGDEAILFIMNDDRNPHTESKGNKLVIDVVGMAYAFNCPADSALWNTLFLSYKIINRSLSIYHDTYIGLFADLDIGYQGDDYIGCDVKRGSFYAYNGKEVDGTGQANAYGAHPPAQSVTFLAGPYMDADGIDNPQYDQYGQQVCDVSINGINFGNGWVDDERFGMNRFIYFNNSGMGAPAYSTDPVIAKDYYNYIKSIWKDSTQMLYGGNGHAGAGAYGPECNFMFPGNSDTCNWGTGSMAPNGPQYWTEVTAGNLPDDRRGLGSSGQFTLMPRNNWVDYSQPFDIAFVFGRDYVDSSAWSSVLVMQQRIDSIRKYFVNDTTPCGGSFSSIAVLPQINPQIKIYPNPADNFINVELTAITGDATYVMYDIVGRKIGAGVLKNSGTNNLNISNLPKGLYFLNVSDGKNKMSKKFVKQ
jgi:hypothetical protein